MSAATDKKIERVALGDYTIQRETEKAVLIAFEFGDREYTAWLPKSQIVMVEHPISHDQTISIPAWLRAAKNEEISDRARRAICIPAVWI